MSKPIVVGICGGSGSGKSWLAQAIVERLPSRSCALLEQDWYYRDLSALDPVSAAQTNFDEPQAIEFALLERQLSDLIAGRAVQAPRYVFPSFSRAAETVAVEPAPVIVVEGLFIVQQAEIRRLLDVSVFVDTPSDIRLIRRIRRDLSERGYGLETILDFWENRAHPMHELHVEPQRCQADRVWKSMEDRAFVAEFLADLSSRLPRNALKPTTPG